VQGIRAAAFGGAVQALGLPPVAAALGLGDSGFDASIEMTGFELLSVAGRSRRPEPQINADLGLAWR
jgi:hypothetical protein